MHYISVGQKLAIPSKSVTFLSFGDLEAGPEEAMQLRRLIKRKLRTISNWGKLSFGIFGVLELRYQGKYLKK